MASVICLGHEPEPGKAAHLDDLIDFGRGGQPGVGHGVAELEEGELPDSAAGLSARPDRQPVSTRLASARSPARRRPWNGSKACRPASTAWWSRAERLSGRAGGRAQNVVDGADRTDMAPGCRELAAAGLAGRPKGRAGPDDRRPETRRLLARSRQIHRSKALLAADLDSLPQWSRDRPCSEVRHSSCRRWGADHRRRPAVAGT